ncbi:hypothetical protein [Chryseobacterium sp. M5A1_1a]
MVALIERLALEGNQKMLEAIKFLLYNDNENIFEVLDFENDLIYKEPFLFTYFNVDEFTNLDSVLFPYCEKEVLKLKTDAYGRFYIPQKGWFSTHCISEELTITKPHYEAFLNSEKIECTLEEIDYVDGTKIELLKYPLPFLEPLFTDADSQVVPVEISEITQQQRGNLAKAYQLIKKYNPECFELLEKFAFKCVVFNTDFMNKNSFSHKYAHGLTFYNSYQEDYDEIFFIDDISHQSAHVILTNILFENDNFFKIDKETSLQELLIGKNIDVVETRTLEVVFHALFTYYFIFDNLDKLYSNVKLNPRQEHEVLGRISIYILKCQNDLLLLEHLFGKEDNIFFEYGMFIFTEMKNKLLEMKNKYEYIYQSYDFKDHPYNFTYQQFAEKNPI